MRAFKLAILGIAFGSFLISSPLFAVSQSGDITVSGTVPTPPPETPPTIDQPSDGTTFDTKNITVSGRCSPDLIVKIYSNNVFVGATICRSDGTYSLNIDLFLDRNNLLARQFDSLNQSSPDSNTVTVFYLPPEQKPQLPGAAPRAPAPTIAEFQLVIDYDYTVQGVFVNKPFHLPVAFRGGTGPYIVTIDWGDGSSNRFQRSTIDPFDVDYTYSRAGRYIVTIRVTDSTGQVAYLQFVVIVHGQPDDPGTLLLFGHKINQDMTLTVILIGSLLLIIAFLAGKGMRRRKIDNQP